MTARRLALSCLLLAGCETLGPLPPAPVEVAPGLLEVRGESGTDADAVAEIAAAARAALPALGRWGPPSHEVTIDVLPDHGALERAIRRPGWPWLRAWARYDVVYVQSPRTWGLFAGGAASLRDLLTHELTHCAMFQAAAGPDDWTSRRIPLWFREGMASWAAKQGDRRFTRHELAEILRRPGGAELHPLRDGEALSLRRPALAYSAAHWAFLALIARFGEPGVRRVLDAMRSGLTFRAAFERALGLSEDDFARAFRADLLRQG